MIYFILESYVKMKIQISHTVVNVSSHQLTENEASLLSMGLNFCPVPGPINEIKLFEELDNFARSLRIKEHFGSKEVEVGDEISSDSDPEDACDNIFVKKREWIPKPSKNVTLESLIDSVKSDILRTAKVNTDTIDNLTPEERTVLQNLRSNEDIIIKPADKGSAVVMDKSAHIREASANIPHSDGIEACKEIWESRSVKVPPTDCLVTMLTMVLKKNNFTFNGDHYL